jgi:hypothetical protein
LGAQQTFSWPYCYGYRDFFYDVPQDDHAWNVTLKVPTKNFTGIYNDWQMELAACPSGKSNYPLSEKDLATLDNQQLVLMNVRPGGRYWIRLTCTSSSNVTVPNYSIGLTGRCIIDQVK